MRTKYLCGFSLSLCLNRHMRGLCYPPTFMMLPSINHDPENKIGARVQCKIQEQSRNDKYQPTSNTEKNTRMKRVEQENKEYNTMPQ